MLLTFHHCQLFPFGSFAPVQYCVQVMATQLLVDVFQVCPEGQAQLLVDVFQVCPEGQEFVYFHHTSAQPLAGTLTVTLLPGYQTLGARGHPASALQRYETPYPAGMVEVSVADPAGADME